jgi:hypothetical protein
MRNLFQVGDRFQLSQGEWSDYRTSEVYIVKTAFNLSEMLDKAEYEVMNSEKYVKLKKPYACIDDIQKWLLANLDLDRVKVTNVYLGSYEYKKPETK